MPVKTTILIGSLFILFLLSACHSDQPATDVPKTYPVVHGWPKLPNGFALGQVSGVGVDSHNHVFVFHRGDRPILCFEADSGEIVNSFGDGMFEQAHGLEVDSQDNVWVTDLDLHQLFKFSHDGELLMTLGVKGEPGLDQEHFNGLTDIAVSSGGDVYVSDGYGNNRIVKFSAGGEYLTEWGQEGDGPGEFNLPHGIALDARERVYVADRSNLRIQVFESDGTFLAEWKGPEIGRPWGLEVGADGYLYVADGGDLKSKPPDRARILRMDLEGHVLEEWGSFGSYDGQFYWLHDVAVGPDSAVYGVDVHLGMRVQKFSR